MTNDDTAVSGFKINRFNTAELSQNDEVDRVIKANLKSDELVKQKKVNDYYVPKKRQSGDIKAEK